MQKGAAHMLGGFFLKVVGRKLINQQICIKGKISFNYIYTLVCNCQ